MYCKIVQNQIVTKTKCMCKTAYTCLYLSAMYNCSMFHFQSPDQIVKFNQPENEPTRNSIIQSKLYLIMGSFPEVSSGSPALN